MWYNAGSIAGALCHKLQTQSSAPEDGRNYRPKHVELIVIINKKLLSLHLVGCLYYCISDAQSQKYQICKEVVVMCFYVKLFLCYLMNGLRKTVRARQSDTRDLLLVDIEDEHDDDKS